MRPIQNVASTGSYPPEVNRSYTRLDVGFLDIKRIGINRAIVRVLKRLTSLREVQAGLFTATLLFEFRPEERP